MSDFPQGVCFQICQGTDRPKIPCKLSWVTGELLGATYRSTGVWDRCISGNLTSAWATTHPSVVAGVPAQLSQKNLLDPRSCLCNLVWGLMRSLLTCLWLSQPPPPLHQGMYQAVNCTMPDLKMLKSEGSLELFTHNLHLHRSHSCGLSRCVAQHDCVGR